MNWVGGVRRRVLLKEEERRRQEQFFAAHASSRLRSARKIVHDAAREKAKGPVPLKPRTNCHQWKNEQVICKRVQQGLPVPPTYLEQQERSLDLTSRRSTSSLYRTGQQKEHNDTIASCSFTCTSVKQSNYIQINPASIHCPFSKYLLQLEVQGIENKLKEQSMRRIEPKRLNKSRRALTDLDLNTGKENIDEDKRHKEERGGKGIGQPDNSIQGNIDGRILRERENCENQIFRNDRNYQKCIPRVKFVETKRLSEKSRTSVQVGGSFNQKLDSKKYENCNVKKGDARNNMNTVCVEKGRRKIDRHGNIRSKKHKSLSIEACNKDVEREKIVSDSNDWKNTHRKGKYIAGSRGTNEKKEGKVASSDKRNPKSEIKRREAISEPSLLKGAPRLRRILTLSPGCHKGQIWVPLKLQENIDTKCPDKVFNQDGHNDKEADTASHFKTQNNESNQSHKSKNDSKSVLAQEQQENHKTLDTDAKEEENRLRILIGKSTKILAVKSSNGGESSIDLGKQIKQCQTKIDKQKQHQESIHPRLITYITCDGEKKLPLKKRSIDNEDSFTCTKNTKKRDLHYIYKDSTLIFGEGSKKTPTSNTGKPKLSNFTRRVYEVENGLSFARNRKDKTPYLDKTIPTPWRSLTCTGTPGGSSGMSSSKTPTDPILEESLEDPFGAPGESEVCGKRGIAQNQDRATVAVHDILSEDENVNVCGKKEEAGIQSTLLYSQSERKQHDFSTTDVRQQNMPVNTMVDERKGEIETCNTSIISYSDISQNIEICRKLNLLDDKTNCSLLGTNEEERDNSDNHHLQPLKDSSSPEYLYDVKKNKAPLEGNHGSFFHKAKKFAKNLSKLKGYPGPDLNRDSTQGMIEHLFFKTNTNTGLFSDSDTYESQEEIQKDESYLKFDKNSRESHKNQREEHCTVAKQTNNVRQVDTSVLRKNKGSSRTSTVDDRCTSSEIIVSQAGHSSSFINLFDFLKSCHLAERTECNYVECNINVANPVIPKLGLCHGSVCDS
ncbi:uncharacterized protein LOC122248483 isoform X2 [Penaeus japonicus]|uniref:uncharacterized protein LOC122248483 isoform X2 n=1 Tax=Penaeus japonicus TaxID=27405 RepID=UPI001C70EC63|nr:uncharacterized protein LOC122248483 isoform X2 [Penaeus japonicus]